MSESSSPSSPRNLVKLTIKCSKRNIALCQVLSQNLRLILSSTPVGVHDGAGTNLGMDEPSVYNIYMYGPDATALFGHIVPFLDVSGLHGTAELQIGERRVPREF